MRTLTSNINLHKIKPIQSTNTSPDCIFQKVRDYTIMFKHLAYMGSCLTRHNGKTVQIKVNLCDLSFKRINDYGNLRKIYAVKELSQIFSEIELMSIRSKISKYASKEGKGRHLNNDRLAHFFKEEKILSKNMFGNKHVMSNSACKYPSILNGYSHNKTS